MERFRATQSPSLVVLSDSKRKHRICTSFFWGSATGAFLTQLVQIGHAIKKPPRTPTGATMRWFTGIYWNRSSAFSHKGWGNGDSAYNRYDCPIQRTFYPDRGGPTTPQTSLEYRRGTAYYKVRAVATTGDSIDDLSYAIHGNEIKWAKGGQGRPKARE
ncbi:hypothetical protein B0H34DRAFT_677869 [Crassisporium funariophilum]|nr:hypothetical protein B0H34DRAFT_677869 [Crassisporium funariophilum]